MKCEMVKKGEINAACSSDSDPGYSPAEGKASLKWAQLRLL